MLTLLALTVGPSCLNAFAAPTEAEIQEAKDDLTAKEKALIAISSDADNTGSDAEVAATKARDRAKARVVALEAAARDGTGGTGSRPGNGNGNGNGGSGNSDSGGNTGSGSGDHADSGSGGKDDKNPFKKEAGKNGTCDASANKDVVGGKHDNCDWTKGIATTTTIVTTGGTVLAQVLASQAGNALQQKAATSEKQSDVQYGAADMGNQLGQQLIVLGSAEVLLGGASYYRGTVHKKAMGEITKEGSALWDKKSAAKTPEEKAALEKKVSLHEDANAEQRAMKSLATEAAVQGLGNGAMHIAQGIANQQNAAAAKAAGDALSNAESQLPTGTPFGLDGPAGDAPPIGAPNAGPTGFTPTKPGGGNPDPFNGIGTPGQLAFGSATTDAPGPEGTGGDPHNNVDLGAPFGGGGDGKGDGAGVPISQVAGKQNPGGVGGGGGGFFGGGTTSGAKDESGGDGQPRQASNSGGERIESGGSAVGGSLGGGKPESGPDLSSLLSLLKGPEKKEDPGGKNILDFGGRGPAGEGGGQEALLGKDVNIFERVHTTYQEKHRHNAVTGKGSGG